MIFPRENTHFCGYGCCKPCRLWIENALKKRWFLEPKIMKKTSQNWSKLKEQTKAHALSCFGRILVLLEHHFGPTFCQIGSKLARSWPQVGPSWPLVGPCEAKWAPVSPKSGQVGLELPLLLVLGPLETSKIAFSPRWDCIFAKRDCRAQEGENEPKLGRSCP